MINEKQKEEIRKEAKEILNNFASALDKVKIKKKEFKKPVGGYRKEGAGDKIDRDFRDSVFVNAPQKEGDCIIVEKKKW